MAMPTTHRHGDGQRRDREHGARTPDQAGENVAAEMIGAEPVRTRG